MEGARRLHSPSSAAAATWRRAAAPEGEEKLCEEVEEVSRTHEKGCVFDDEVDPPSEGKMNCFYKREYGIITILAP